MSTPDGGQTAGVIGDSVPQMYPLRALTVCAAVPGEAAKPMAMRQAADGTRTRGLLHGKQSQAAAGVGQGVRPRHDLYPSAATPDRTERPAPQHPVPEMYPEDAS